MKIKVRPMIKTENKDVLKPNYKRLKVGKASKSKKNNKGKSPKKDPNKPKKPLTAFFLFMQGFRKTYKEKHPLQKSVTVVAKAGAEKWNTLSSGEKVPYEAKVAKDKLEYEKLVKDYYEQKHNQESTADDKGEESEVSEGDKESLKNPNGASEEKTSEESSEESNESEDRDD